MQPCRNGLKNRSIRLKETIVVVIKLVLRERPILVSALSPDSHETIY